MAQGWKVLEENLVFSAKLSPGIESSTSLLSSHLFRALPFPLAFRIQASIVEFLCLHWSGSFASVDICQTL